jgi:hypothetical protein
MRQRFFIILWITIVAIAMLGWLAGIGWLVAQMGQLIF